MPKPTLIISVLRDPVERLLSAYNHLYRSHGKHIFLQITRQGKPLSSINEFLDDQAIFPYTINPQLFSLGHPMSVPEIISRGKSLTRFSWQSPCTKSFELLYGPDRANINLDKKQLLQTAFNRINDPLTMFFTTPQLNLCLDSLKLMFHGSKILPFRLLGGNLLTPSLRCALSLNQLEPSQINEFKSCVWWHWAV